MVPLALVQQAPPTAAPVVLVRRADIDQKIAAWRKAYPELVHVGSLGKSREGRDIVLVRLGRGAAPPDDRPETLLLAGIHPREQQPAICLMLLVDELLAGQAGDERLRWILERQTIWLVPAFNVDGKAWEEAHPDWRKSRTRNADGSVGVDLNRNFAVRWGGARALDALWRTTTDTPAAEIYEGPAPLSEPETRALAAFFESRPNLRAFLDIHSPLREILHPAYLPVSDGLRFTRIAEGMRRRQSDRPYAVIEPHVGEEPPARERAGNSGLTYHHAYYTRGIFGFNFEISVPTLARGVEGRYPKRADIEREWKANVRDPWLFFLESAPDLPPTRPGAAKLVGEGRAVSPLAPGTTVGWFPPTVDGPCDWASLVSESPDVQVLSEMRFAPFATPFTLRVSPGAKPGTAVPLTLYLWDKGRRRSVQKVTVTIANPLGCFRAQTAGETAPPWCGPTRSGDRRAGPPSVGRPLPEGAPGTP